VTAERKGPAPARQARRGRFAGSSRPSGTSRCGKPPGLQSALPAPAPIVFQFGLAIAHALATSSEPR
jgi:hypothetical protein